MKTKVAVQLSCKRLGRQKCGALEVPMPSCSICEQFLYLIKTQGRRRRLRRRLGQRVSGCRIRQVEAILEAESGCPTPAPWG
jgi:hypothetical protein